MKKRTFCAAAISLTTLSLWTACSPVDPGSTPDTDAATDAIAPPPPPPPPPPPDAHVDAKTPLDAATDATSDGSPTDASDASTDAASPDSSGADADAALLGCPAGSREVGPACAPCAQGTYSELPNSRSCTACADDFSTAAAMSTLASQCTPCAANEYSNAATDHLCVAATTVFTTAGLTDFDINGTHLVYRTPGFVHCTLPACADPTTLAVNPAMRPDAWFAGDDDLLYYAQGGGAAMPLDLASRTYANVAGPTVNLGTSSSSYSQNLVSFHRGLNPMALVREVPKPLGGGRFQYNWGGRSGNSFRTAQATGMRHNNGAALASYIPARQVAPPPGAGLPSVFAITGHPGASAPKPATDPTIVAVSAPGGADPTVFVVRGGMLEACPLATPCVAWRNLGAMTSPFNVDATHLYVGTDTGLKRCALAEIGASSTCTLVAAGPNEAVSAPLYLTATDAWYLSGATIRTIPK